MSLTINSKIFSSGFNNQKTAKVIIYASLLLLVADMVYSNINGITMLNREARCVLYAALPRWLFLLYEYLVETTIVVLAGVFVGALIEVYIKKVKRFFPRNQFLAFVYAAVLPVCACGVIPLIEAMKQRVSLRVIITFVISAPLLNPYIIILSYTVLGWQYCLIRVVGSLVLAVGAGFVVDVLSRRFLPSELGRYVACSTSCGVKTDDPFVNTIALTKKLMPFIIVGGLVTFGLEMFNPKQYLSEYSFSNDAGSMLSLLVLGIPIYVCNGADIFLMKPLLSFTDLSLGASMVFSLTSSAVCISSIAMLAKFFGKKLTALIVIAIAVLTLAIGSAVNLVL